MEMATKSTVRYIFTVLFLSVICCNCQSDNPGGSSWAKLQISPDTLSSMEYGNFLVEIYEHANNHKATTTAGEKKYFYSPIALLDNKSAVSRLNRVTKQSEMRFRVEMWNDKIQNEVVKHLNEIIGHEIKSNKVRVIPLEKVILTSNTPTTDYSLSPVWTNYDKSKTLRLSLSCFEQKICDELASEMRSDPEQFDHFKLLYSLSSQTSQTKQTTISIDSVTSGQMVSTLLQKFKNKKEIFLTANDEKKMLTETATNIRMDTFDDSEVGSPDTESQILNILKDLLVTSRTTIKDQSDKMWDSVFWNEDNYRPDKTTKSLNEIIKKLDTETQTKLADMFQEAEKQSVLIDKFSSSNKEEESIGEEQIRRENESKDANEKEIRRSQATDQEQSSRNQTRDDESNTNKDKTEVSGGGWGIKFGVKVGVEKNNTHNAKKENEKSEHAKTNSDEYNRNLENKERIHHNFDLSSWADVDRISSVISRKMANDSDGSRRVEISKEEIAKLLQESRNHVQWDGENFVPKPMQLSRINLAKFRDSQSFQDRNVRVRYTTAELSAPIKFLEHAELTVTDEWNNLKDELKATTELLRATVNNLLITNTELSNAKSDLSNTRIELASKLEGTKQQLGKTEIDLEETKAYINILSIKLNEAKQELVKTRADFLITVDDLSAKLNARTSEIVDIGKMPTSCADLQRTGHKLSGFFSVKGAKKMEMIYCNFNANQNDKQKWIGYADVKSAPVHFYVQREFNFNLLDTPITYNLARVNEGNAMDLPSGIFTAPRQGTYYFAFTALAKFSASSSLLQFKVFQYLNGGRIGTGYVSESNTDVIQFSQMSYPSTLSLVKGDQVWMEIGLLSPQVSLFDDIYHFTHYTGFMLEEEIVASL
ncbi:uncharacterized protein LOC124336056 isoform X4 [Daphnia pulicaria]|uniref:uncharacterized protein LOC124336056 isoform X4 n=1 Tax=Daphnia pulicaria TaxID=35523 RepID=UPI001EEB8B91|nr:uncharacterized protein LOC124336056 isoform X4 [Daphnia pulicaria]